MFMAKQFYDYFQVNYFDYKQSNNEFLLSRSSKDMESLCEDIGGTLRMVGFRIDQRGG